MDTHPYRIVRHALALAVIIAGSGASTSVARACDPHSGPSGHETSTVAAAPPPAYVPPTPAPAAPYAVHHGHVLDPQYRSPGLAVALSLTPMPVDFGNFYAENLGWGAFYTALEVSLVIPMLWVAGGHMGMSSNRNDPQAWSVADRNAVVTLASSYVAVKVVAGLHAGYTVRDLNDRVARQPYAAVVPVPGGASALVGMRF